MFTTCLNSKRENPDIDCFNLIHDESDISVQRRKDSLFHK